MNKKFLALALAANCITSQYAENQKPAVTEEQVALAQVETAKEALKGMDGNWTSAEMGATISVLGVVASLATLYFGQGNPDLQNYVLATCSTATAGGLWVTWTGSNQRGNPDERKKLITIIEHPRTISR